jgi:hypothetical protein
VAQSSPCQQEKEEEGLEELCIIPSSSTEECLSTNKIKGPKKNYELLAPFKFFCTLCSFKTKRESHYQTHLVRHETVSSIFFFFFVPWVREILRKHLKCVILF